MTGVQLEPRGPVLPDQVDFPTLACAVEVEDPGISLVQIAKVQRDDVRPFPVGEPQPAAITTANDPVNGIRIRHFSFLASHSCSFPILVMS